MSQRSFHHHGVWLPKQNKEKVLNMLKYTIFSHLLNSFDLQKSVRSLANVDVLVGDVSFSEGTFTILYARCVMKYNILSNPKSCFGLSA